MPYGDELLAYLPAGTYTLSGNPNSTVTGYINGWYTDGTAIPQMNDTGSGRTFTLEQDAYVYYQIMVANGVSVTAFLYPQLEAGPTTTPFEPYTGGIPSPNPKYPQTLVSVENSKLVVCSKNLWNKDVGSDPANWTLSLKQPSYNEIPIYVGKGNTVTCSYSQTLEGGLGFYGGFAKSVEEEITEWLYHSTATTLIHNTVTITASQDVIYLRVSGASVVNGNFMKYIGNDLQIELGETATDYEPYNGSSIAITQTLRGIPVSEGGNYTDENGQQWICDEVDLERGVYIRRIAEDIVDGTTSLVHKNGDASDKYLYYHGLSEASKRLPGCCTHFTHLDAYAENPSQYGTFNLTKATAAYFNAYGLVSGDNATITDSTEFNNWFREQHEAGTPVTFYYAIETPIETPLTAEEIETYKALKTNYPNTTILNNAGAWMKIKYNADTKLYIDNTSVNGAVSAVEEVLNDTY